MLLSALLALVQIHTTVAKIGYCERIVPLGQDQVAIELPRRSDISWSDMQVVALGRNGQELWRSPSYPHSWSLVGCLQGRPYVIDNRPTRSFEDSKESTDPDWTPSFDRVAMGGTLFTREHNSMTLFVHRDGDYGQMRSIKDVSKWDRWASDEESGRIAIIRTGLERDGGITLRVFDRNLKMQKKLRLKLANGDDLGFELYNCTLAFYDKDHVLTLLPIGVKGEPYKLPAIGSGTPEMGKFYNYLCKISLIDGTVKPIAYKMPALVSHHLSVDVVRFAFCLLGDKKTMAFLTTEGIEFVDCRSLGL